MVEKNEKFQINFVEVLSSDNSCLSVEGVILEFSYILNSWCFFQLFWGLDKLGRRVYFEFFLCYLRGKNGVKGREGFGEEIVILLDIERIRRILINI